MNRLYHNHGYSLKGVCECMEANNFVAANLAVEYNNIYGTHAI